MRRHGQVYRVRRYLPLILTAVLAMATTLSGCLDQKTGRFFLPVGIDEGLDPTTGDIFGTVTVDGVPRSGVTVTVRRNGITIDMVVTDANGRYEVLEQDPGTYTVSISTISGATCPGDQTAVVVAGDDTRVDFACTSTPTTGTVTGTVTANGSAISGATVTLDGRTATTDANGMFTFMNVEAGSYGVTASASGFDCQGATVMVTADQTATVDIACTSSAPSGEQIADDPFSLEATGIGVDGCQIGSTISNPGPIVFTYDPQTMILVKESDVDVAGVYVPGQVWTGMGEGTFSSGGTTFVLRETDVGTWSFQSGVIVLNSVLTFQVFQGGTQVCESAYNATYTQLVSSSRRFKSGVRYLLPDGLTILGLRPVAYRYLRPWGDPGVLRVGLIAEDVARVYPEAVAVDGTGRAWGIGYGTLRARVGEEIARRAAAGARDWLEGVAEAIGRG